MSPACPSSASATSPRRRRRATRRRGRWAPTSCRSARSASSASRACSTAIPAGARYYVTIDIDGFDPSIAPGTGTPSHGGFVYYEGLEILAGLAARGTIVGVDLVEVAPDYDHTGTTAILAAQVLMNLIGRVMHQRSLRG